jgi:hypothetical protein
LVIPYPSGPVFRKPWTNLAREQIMQRLLNNLLTVAVMGLISTSASLVMAHGGSGGHSSGAGRSSGGHSGSSHSGAGRSVTHTSSNHTPLARDLHSRKSPNGHIGKPTNFVQLVPNNPPGTIPNYPPIHLPPRHPWHYHMHYPVGFWFGGNLDVADADAVDGGIDVEFTKIRQLDAGDPAKNLAPAYRVWFHNNSDVDIGQPFDVAILASNDDKLSQGLPYASVRVDSLAADETTSVDIRLPIAAMTMGSTDGQASPFTYVHTIIDAQKELVETNKANNLSLDSRDNIPAVEAE